MGKTIEEIISEKEKELNILRQQQDDIEAEESMKYHESKASTILGLTGLKVTQISLDRKVDRGRSPYCVGDIDEVILTFSNGTILQISSEEQLYIDLIPKYINDNSAI